MLRLLVLLVLVCTPLLRLPHCWAQPSLSARIVKCKQGSVKGVLVVPANRELQPVEAFLGIPYASPPVGALRFMPPVSPLPWNGLRTMDKYGPACPQTLPDISNEREALRFVSRGRLQYLRRLLPYLRNQSEDCLYLNIYAPVTVGAKDANIKFPVIVFIHGESYEWNSGNPYDGSILASYGDVVVVTLNFRLGILGFLRPDLRENKVANFGLLDQIAALQWIKENIGEFGGNPDSVTLMGHGTGAACVNLLLTSPVAQASSGLFHRAILMSGTALSDWAITDNPLRYTLQAAQQMNCPLAERDDELATCLRFKKVTDLMNIRLQAPLYASPLAPLVDGIVVPNEPRQSMKTYNELFGRYDVLYGVTQSESFHLLNAQTLQFGLAEADRNRIIRTYVRNNYAYNIDQVTAAILNEYTDWKNPTRDTEDYRDSVLEVLSDARVVAPVVQMADMHSAIRQKSYFYVFAHQTSNGDFPQNWGSIHGEELAYVFGMPLVGGTNHLTMNYTRAEMLLSEMVITYWTNFARTGNPNFPPRQKFLSVSLRDRFDPTGTQQWPTYDRHSQKYLSIELRPKVKDHYRADKMALWSKLIPELVSNAIVGGGGSAGAKGPGADNEEDLTATPTGGFRPTLPFPLATTSSSSSSSSSTSRTKSGSPSPPATEIPSETSNPAMGAEPALSGGATPQDSHFPFHVTANNGTSANRNAATAAVGPSGNVALSIVIVVGLCFLVLNVCACAGVFYQRDRVRFKERLLQKRYKLRPVSEGSPTQRAAGGDASRPQGDNKKRSTGDKDCDRADLPLQASTSTVDPHAKVRQWIAQEMADGSETMTPPSQRKVRKMHNTLTVDGSSDRYDLRDAVSDPSGLFPLLNKSAMAAAMDDIQSFTTDGGDQVIHRPTKRDTPTANKGDRSTTTLQAYINQQRDAIRDAVGSPIGQLEAANPNQTSPIAGDSTNRRYSTTGRRKGRTKSQLSLHRSVNKRDVAVGNDSDLPDEDDGPSNQSCGHDTMDTIRRLNLPKVLPDLPTQEAKLKSYCAVPTSSTSTTADPLYAAPIRQSTASADSPLPASQSEYALPPADSPVIRDRIKPPMNVVKTNLQHTLVMAPHPRSAQVASIKATPSNNLAAVSGSASVARPGPRSATVIDDPVVASQSASKSPSNPILPPLAVQEDLDVNVQLRPSQLQGVRPRSQRNSRSWYPQYSQSLISQSIDQDSEAQDI